MKKTALITGASGGVGRAVVAQRYRTGICRSVWQCRLTRAAGSRSAAAE